MHCCCCCCKSRLASRGGLDHPGTTSAVCWLDIWPLRVSSRSAPAIVSELCTTETTTGVTSLISSRSLPPRAYPFVTHLQPRIADNGLQVDFLHFLALGTHSCHLLLSNFTFTCSSSPFALSPAAQCPLGFPPPTHLLLDSGLQLPSSVCCLLTTSWMLLHRPIGSMAWGFTGD